MQLAALNSMDRAAYVETLGRIFEHSPWVAERSFGDRPFASVGRGGKVEINRACKVEDPFDGRVDRSD